MKPMPFNWKQFHSYRVFDEFLESLVIKRRSYVTRHDEPLDLEAALAEIEERFVAGADEAADVDFDTKVRAQFEGATEQAKIVFANMEYLWAMPMEKTLSETKRSYVLRWFGDAEVVSGEGYFFRDVHSIASMGPWYLQNKYYEIVAVLRVLSLLIKKPGLTDIAKLKTEIAKICYSAIYEGVPSGERFAVEKVCGIHSALLHLADPERYESIISASHREQICAVLGHVVEDTSADEQSLLKQIRAALYPSHGNSEEPDFKYRWFFYSKDVRPLWNDKTTQKAQRVSSAIFDVRLEEEAEELEGEREAYRGVRILRSSKLVSKVKKRDAYKCRACGFHFEDQIVHVHHLDPVSEYKCPQATKPEDLITLCPNCHYLAHYWLRVDSQYKMLDQLLAKLKLFKVEIDLSQR